MRRFAVAASASLLVFAVHAPAFAAAQLDDMGYLPPPTPIDYERTLQQVAQLPAFKAQVEMYAPAPQARPAPQPVIQYAQNYQVPAVPDYLPMTRMAAQRATNIYGSGANGADANYNAGYNAGAPMPENATYIGEYANNATFQPAGFVTQNSVTPYPQYETPANVPQLDASGRARQPIPSAPSYGTSANAAPSYGAPSYDAPPPQLAAEPMPMQPTPQYAPLPVPQYVPQAMPMPVDPMAQAPMPVMPIAPAPQMMPQQAMMAPMPVPMEQAVPVEPVDMAPMAMASPGYMPLAPMPSMPYNPPVMDGNPRYDSVPFAPRAPSMAYDPSWRENGFYGAFRTGLTLPGDTSFSNAGGKFINEYHTGWNLSGGIGYAFAAWDSWIAPRLEGEFGMFSQSIQKHKIGTLSFEDPNAYGDTMTLTGMLNAYLDFRPFQSRVVQPYITGGAGMGVVDFDRHGVTTPVMNNDAVGFAWQGGAGVGFRLSRGTFLDVGYRYLQVSGIELMARDNTKSSTDIDEHVLNIGLRQNF